MDIRTICSDRKKIADRDIENIYMSFVPISYLVLLPAL